jgi:PLP dependent protein
MIGNNVRRILSELPAHVELVGAAKTRTVEEIVEAVEAGLRIVGQNYVQEAERARAYIGGRAAWHMIGHLQSNKAGKAVEIFDMIETVDSPKLAAAIAKACRSAGKSMPVLIEINSADEPRKAGVRPEEAEAVIREIARLEQVRVMGLMTMGPLTGAPEAARPFFRRTRVLFEEIRELRLPGVEMRHLSMGMSDSYRVAIEEGANLVRIGTLIFGPRRAGGE